MKQPLPFLITTLLLPLLGAQSATLLVDACKEHHFDAKIAGGSRARNNQYEWYAISLHNRFLCGATLLSPTALLTAAHCKQAFAPGTAVRIGSNERDAGGVVREVVAVEPHEAFDETDFSNDIMVVWLDEAVKDIEPIQLNTRSRVPVAEQRLKATGFGSDEPDGPPTSTLMQVELQVMDTAECSTHYYDAVRDVDGERVVIDDKTIVCAAGADGTANTCRGDSGGPLVTLQGVQVGIISSSAGACGLETSAPTLFTRVSAYIDWIEDWIGE